MEIVHSILYILIGLEQKLFEKCLTQINLIEITKVRNTLEDFFLIFSDFF